MLSLCVAVTAWSTITSVKKARGVSWASDQSVAQAPTETENTVGLTSVDNLLNTPLFGVAVIEEDTLEPDVIPIEALPETALAWRLAGTFISSYDRLSSALLTTDDQQQARYYVGDSISDNAVLRDVTLGAIVIDNQGVLETLSLYAGEDDEGMQPRHRRRTFARQSADRNPQRASSPHHAAPTRASRTGLVSSGYRTLSERLAARQKR